MEFLNKLYENDYFGIGLFCVIVFLVVTFLIVLYFGKKDEKKRKLEEKNQFGPINQESENTFKETTVATPVEVPTVEAPVMEPIASVASVEPVQPVNPVEPVLEPVAPIQFEPINNSFVENRKEEEAFVQPIFNDVVNPVVNDVMSPVIPSVEPVIVPIQEEKIDVPVITDSILQEISQNEVSNEIVLEPVIQEKMEPLIIEDPVSQEVPVQTFYEPIEKEETQEVEVPSIDFDAIAKSISKELDDLEKTNENKTVNVTPMEKIKPANQFSSVYVNEPVKSTVIPKTRIELPKKIELPSMKTEENRDEIEPESYRL